MLKFNGNSIRLAVELDGLPRELEAHAVRLEVLELRDVEVIRFWKSGGLRDIEAVLELILKVLHTKTLTLVLSRGERG